MSHTHSSGFTGQAMRRSGLAVLLALAATDPTEALAQVPAEYQGTWIPVKATLRVAHERRGDRRPVDPRERDGQTVDWRH